jgi:hypothetical protein
VQSSDGALRFKPVYRPKPGQEVRVEEEQARDVAQDEMDSEDDLRGQIVLLTGGLTVIIP